MSRVGDIHFVPISEYKRAYNLIQAFIADFEFNEEEPIEKAILIHFIHQLAKHLDETKCEKLLKDKNITEEQQEEYFNQLISETLK